MSIIYILSVYCTLGGCDVIYLNDMSQLGIFSLL